jgi:hypothetical protein
MKMIMSGAVAGSGDGRPSKQPLFPIETPLGAVLLVRETRSEVMLMIVFAAYSVPLGRRSCSAEEADSPGKNGT